MAVETKVRVSVVVPVYNVEKYLRQCVDSLIGQTLRDIQIILVDDGSKDISGQIIDQYAEKDERITAIHKENGGISSARNEGVKHATGDFITFVDSDDWIDLDMYQTMVEAADKYHADIVSSAMDIKQAEVHKKDILSKQLLRGDMSVCNKIFRRNALVGEDFAFDLKNVAIDIKACYDLFAKCKCWVLIPKAFYNYRQDNVSYGRSGFCQADLNCVRLTEEVTNLAKAVSEETYRCAANHVIHAKFDILNKAILFGYKSDKDRELYEELKKGYIKDIRSNISSIIQTTYFSKNEKLQMLVMSISFPLFKLIKRGYKRLVGSSCESIKC